MVTTLPSSREAEVERYWCDGRGDDSPCGTASLSDGLLRAVGTAAEHELVSGQLGACSDDGGPVVLRRQGYTKGVPAVCRSSQQRYCQPDDGKVRCVRDTWKYDAGSLASRLGERKQAARRTLFFSNSIHVPGTEKYFVVPGIRLVII